MVGFRNATAGTDVSDWQVPDDTTIAFGRGDRGFVVINLGTGSFSGTFDTSMDPGTYCDVVSGCQADNVGVEADGTVTVSLSPMSAVAIHRNSLLEP
jgi:alpha-amylase